MLVWKESILNELKLLRSEGLEEIALSDESLQLLLPDPTHVSGEACKRPVPTSSPPGKTKAVAKKAPMEIPLDELRREKPRKTTSFSSPGKIASTDIPEPEPFELPDLPKAEQYEWLREKILHCSVCQKNLNPGKKLVVGTGNLEGDLFFCGEAPGAEEENTGLPFVGQAGQLLDKMILAMGLTREDVYIGNIMNWRPQTGSSYGNRPPTAKEMTFCLPYLKAQVQIVRPKVLVALGATATQGLLELESKPTMAKYRSQWREYNGIPLMITYHPSFLLHNTTLGKKRQVWEDLLKVMEKLELPISDKQKGYFLK